MAENTAEVGISSRTDTTGFDQAKQGLKETEDAAKSLKEQASSAADEGVKKLSEALAEMATLAEVVSFLKDSTQEFYNEEKAVRAVATAAQAYGGQAGAVTKAGKEWAEQMALMGGVSIPTVTSALGEQLQRTGDLADAQHRVALAMDIGTATGKGFEYGMHAVNAAVLGQARALKDLVPGIKGITDAHEVAAKGMAYLEEHFYGATEKINDNAKAADQAKVRWAAFKEELGAEVAPAITLVRDTLMKVKDAVILLASEFGAMVVKTVQNAMALKTFFEEAFVGSASAASKKMLAAMENNERDYHATIEALEEKALADQEKRETKGTEARRAANDGKLKSDLATAAAEKKLIETWTINDLNSTGTTMKAFTDAQAFMRADSLKTTNAFLVEAKKREVIDADTITKGLKLAEEAHKKKLALAKQELAMQVEIAKGVVGALTNAFGQSKELSIASAIISTYEGAAKALAQGGIYGTILAAVVIASGLAQVAKIESTQPASSGGSTSGSGFDDPNNDQAAELGGRRWANDMIGKFTKGVSSGWAQGMAGAGAQTSNTYHYDNRRVMNVSGVGLVDASNTEMLKKLARGLDMVNRNSIGASRIGSAPRG